MVKDPDLKWTEIKEQLEKKILHFVNKKIE
jgi:hypothetical protein